MKWPLVWRSTLDILEQRYNRIGDRVVELGRTVELRDATIERQHGEMMRADGVLRQRDQTIHEMELRHERALVAAEARYAELLSRVQVLAPTPQAVARAILDTPIKELDAVSRTIREQSEGNIQLANHLRRYAKKLRDNGFNADQIVGKLVAWQSTEPDEAAS